jgi:hypothetical protein
MFLWPLSYDILTYADFSRSLRLMSIFHCLHRFKGAFPLLHILSFYSEELLASYSTPKLEDHRLSAARDFICKIFADPTSALKRRIMP